jgi:hypothetical protein
LALAVTAAVSIWYFGFIKPNPNDVTLPESAVAFSAELSKGFAASLQAQLPRKMGFVLSALGSLRG